MQSMMTKFVFLVFLYYSSISLSASNMTTVNPEGKKPVPCTIPFSELDYAGTKFSGKNVCVQAPNEIEARKLCPAGFVVNPANPQYSDKGPFGRVSGSITYTQRATNPENYFYCVGTKNQKPILCRENSNFPNVTFEFRVPPGKSDGDCYCGPKNAMPTELKNCSNYGAVADVEIDYSRMCEANGFRADTRDPKDIDLAVRYQIQCQCPPGNDNYYTFSSTTYMKEKCNDKPQTPPVAADPTSKPPEAVSAANKVDPLLEDCVKNWKSLSEKCGEMVTSTKKVCAQIKKDNETTTTLSKVLGAGGSIFATLNQGSGAQAECFKAGMISSLASEAIKGLQGSCQEEQKKCFDTCSLERYDEFTKLCPEKINTTSEALSNSSNTTANANYYRQYAPEIRKNFDLEKNNICRESPDDISRKLSESLNMMGNNMNAAARCACKLSSGAVQKAEESCDAIPSPEYCQQVPQPAGCNSYGTFAICTPGATGYDAKTCACMTNSSAPECTGVVARNTNPFAGPGMQLPTNSNSSFAGGLSGTPKGSGNFDGLGSGAGDLEGGGPTLTLGAARTGAGSGGTGGGGLGGGGGPSGNGPLAETNGAGDTGEETEKGVGGLFNQAKSFLTGALGMGKGKNNSNGRGGNGSNNGFDSGKFKPKRLRGLANSNENGIGSKNSDIWKMMNLCMSGESCKSNVNNYLTAP